MSTPVNGGLTLALAVSECPKGLGCVNAVPVLSVASGPIAAPTRRPSLALTCFGLVTWGPSPQEKKKATMARWLSAARKKYATLLHPRPGHRRRSPETLDDQNVTQAVGGQRWVLRNEA
jgi:hypothetical protein